MAKRSLPEERKPDMAYKVGETTIEIYGPGPMTEEERKRRHAAIVRAVGKCLVTATRQD
ncbi:hypothetical protein [Alicyclobacillus pomorum]|jgi:hypothetical protein|uniref:hypothetical protein n=1 Tax=Alicyclobacillus pomorum TaxID=204470 RepID=UPI0004186787|nr:hypothetical protein [Alicyclobacillus pomorum]